MKPVAFYTIIYNIIKFRMFGEKRQIELLSPARDLECGMAAIDHGADAVYIGATHFGARAAAANSMDDIAALCRYAHRYDARVYVTVNTIVYDSELPALRLLLRQTADAGADAVLFQDLAVPAIVKEERLPLQLHASTQTDNRTAEKVQWLASQGASRVVLARELSAAEIADIHRKAPTVELEVFVHGALCVSYSGQCYASQHCFKRSANRGECAQMCRMKYNLTDADGHVIVNDRHLLSLKDLNQSTHIEELIQAGAASLKIEGRLKDTAYVKNVTAAYSQLLDRFIDTHPGEYERTALGRCRYTFTPDLDKTFNRGYTTYFLHGRQPDIFSPHTPKAIGEHVGTVKRLVRDGRQCIVIAPPPHRPNSPTPPFANGDGLCFIDDNHRLQGFRVNRAEGNRLTPAGNLPPTLRKGMDIYRNSDHLMERVLAGKSGERKIPLTMTLTATTGGYELKASDGRHTMTATVECGHQKAEKPQNENILRELSKLGNTPYECEKLVLPPDFDFFIPASRLSLLRRRLTSPTPQLPTSPTPQLPNSPTPHLHTSPTTSLPPLHYSPTPHLPYMLNAANHIAADIYRQHGAQPAPAYELREPEGENVVMQCRHCLRYALGHCTKGASPQSPWREPLFLTLANGTRFRLQFDCTHCVMNVIANGRHSLPTLI